MRGIQYYGYRFTIFAGFNVYVFVDLVNYVVLTLVGEIRRYKNDRYYYNYNNNYYYYYCC